MICCEGHIGIRNDSCITCLHAVRSRQLGGERCCSSGMSYGFSKEASTCRIEVAPNISLDDVVVFTTCVKEGHNDRDGIHGATTFPKPI